MENNEKFLLFYNLKLFSSFKSYPEINSVAILSLIFKLANTLGQLYVACEICQRLSNAFMEIDDGMGQLDWYRFPHEIKKVLPIILVLTQQPFAFECIGSISCNRETYIQVGSI